ncbi:copper resistance system multicopper oxidase [Limibaculum sp. FT325]|uniref:copper resistance system multicopper oxidase n=1 Tax=Thermohalobaculum sediminis TaxID=2939436 RepID=UPI0020BD750B|nr:copper resistance system multicopper oxidase [Limibaculum sediminis]MCL5776920.1 copper resistance system multicopper oxidase [Limibaculum sediminis]
MTRITRFRAGVLAAAVGAALSAAPAWAGTYDLTVDRVRIDTGAFTRTGIGYNGASPGPVLRFREGEDVTINVTNNLDQWTSVHWHGLILPYQQDGVPGVSFEGIAPGQTFTYRFPIVQAGTYWFHSHSGFQEADGAYGAIVIEPATREPFRYDRDYVVQLTDAHPHPGSRIMRNLKMMPDYYNRQQRTLFDFLGDAADEGLGAALSDRADWGGMRMMPTDVEDVQGFTPLMNGKGPEGNWTALFEPGERVRLRFINSSAMAYFDIRIPGLKMTVVQADGQNVQPVTVDELRIAVAETYDVIVRPTEDRAYSILAESVGRTAMARGTLAPREGMEAEVPALREPPRLTMADMGMAHGGMDHGSMGHGATAGDSHVMPDGTMMQGMDHGAAGDAAAGTHVMPNGSVMAGAAHAGMGSDSGTHTMPDGSVMEGMAHGGHRAAPADRFYAPGSGLTPVVADGGRFLSYADLKAQKPLYPERAPTREIELRLTGNMERYIWSFDGVKHEDAEPIRLQYGERVRFTFVNETMMTHPMHLHGMWSILDTGNGAWNPAKHVVSVPPGTTVAMEVEVDAPGRWVFHCHLAYHMEAGMMREVIVEGGPEGTAVDLGAGHGHGHARGAGG